MHFSSQTSKFLIKFNLLRFHISGGLTIFFTEHDYKVSTISSKMDFYSVTSSRPFTHGQISWILEVVRIWENYIASMHFHRMHGEFCFKFPKITRQFRLPPSSLCIKLSFCYLQGSVPVISCVSIFKPV